MVGKSPDNPKDPRKPLRLKKYPYQKPGCYFVTFATRNMERLFGEVIDGRMLLNELGVIAEEEWRKTAQMRPGVELDEFVIMPNHIHGIIRIKEWGAGALGATIGGFKAAVSSRINKLIASEQGGCDLEGGRKPPARAGRPRPIWHRNYYERIVRDEKELERIREYIRKNPEKWEREKDRRK